MKPHVRLAEEGDASGLLALYRVLRPHDSALSSEEATALLSRLLAHDGTRLVVCELDGILASTCMLCVTPSFAVGGRPFAVVEHVVTLPAHRRLGLARMTLEFALALAWESECYKVMLLSGAQREEAHRLYRSIGFRDDIEIGIVAKPTRAP
jgi:GNAT superfamily N-acetyltransferase